MVSLLVCVVISALIWGLILWLCPLYMIICFAVGAVLGFAMFINKLGPRNKPMFEPFCTGYYRFVPDDELRTAMYNKKLGQIKLRLHAMGIQGSFVPAFKEEKK